MKKIRDIMIEIDRTVVVNARRQAVVARCAACAAEVRMVTVDEAAAIARVTARTIYRGVEAGRIHFIETPSGALYICLKSLSQT